MTRMSGFATALVTMLLLLAVNAAAGDKHAQSPAPFDAMTRAALGADFNGVVLVRDGVDAPDAVRTFGMANFESERPLTATTRFQIGSASKWIATLVVLRLVDEGKLELDVPVRRYLPDLPQDTGERVTLRHLLSNTSGIPNGVMQAFKKDRSIATLSLTSEQAAMRFGNGEVQTEPGATFDYSLTNWVIVAAIVERATGTSFAKAIEDHVATPLGLQDTGVPATQFSEVTGGAIAYGSIAPPKRKMDPVPSFAAASGTVYSTANDLTKIARATYEGDFLSPTMRAELLKVEVPAENYALGGRVKTLELGGHSRTVAWESGAIGGFKSLLVHVPGDGRTIVILNNTDMPQAAQASAAELILKRLYERE